MLVFQDSGNIPSLLLTHAISTRMTDICEIQFLHKTAAHNSIQVKIYDTLGYLDTLPVCGTLHKTQFFKESLEIKFKAFYRHTSSKATLVLQKLELITIVSTLIIFIIHSCCQAFQYLAKMILTKTDNIFKKNL